MLAVLALHTQTGQRPPDQRGVRMGSRERREAVKNAPAPSRTFTVENYLTGFADSLTVWPTDWLTDISQCLFSMLPPPCLPLSLSRYLLSIVLPCIQHNTTEAFHQTLWDGRWGEVSRPGRALTTTPLPPPPWGDYSTTILCTEPGCVVLLCQVITDPIFYQLLPGACCQVAALACPQLLQHLNAK